jgi:hypothetical protein
MYETSPWQEFAVEFPLHFSIPDVEECRSADVQLVSRPQIC